MWVKLFISLLLVGYLKAECNVCQSGKAACLSRYNYSICIDGKPVETSRQCPTGYICTGEKYICYQEAEGYVPICLDEADDISSTTEESTTITSMSLSVSTVSASLTTPVIDDADDDFKQFCTANGDGNFQNENDPTCKTFILCLSGEGSLEDCQRINKKPTYFNGVECKFLKPDNCT